VLGVLMGAVHVHFALAWLWAIMVVVPEKQHYL
jgi:hypothetical protein